jgi:TonB family protein
MLPRALLFSSDPQVAELILALLPEFGIEVEHCQDVFGAIEKLTSRPYQAIVVDWKEQLEASFLLKTMRELTASKSTPAIAVVDQNDVSAALNAGAAAVLIKPLAFEQARRTFIGALPQICSKQSTPEQNNVRQAPPPPSPAPIPPSAATPKPVLSTVPARLLRTAVPKPPTFAGYAQGRSRSVKHRHKHIAVVLLGLLAVGFLFPQSTRLGAQFLHAVRVSRFALGSAAPRVQPPDPDAAAPPTTAPTADLDYDLQMPRTPVRPAAAGVVQIYPRSIVPKPLPTIPRSAPAAALLDETELKVSHPEIPPSLMVSVQAMTTHSRQSRLSSTPGNRWSTEPIMLPETVSRELLVRQVIPKYPDLALVAGVEGSVLLHALVGKDGSIQDLKLISGPLVLGRAAFDSVKEWRYRPYRLNGQMVEMQTFITLNFTRTPNTALAQKLP